MRARHRASLRSRAAVFRSLGDFARAGLPWSQAVQSAALDPWPPSVRQALGTRLAQGDALSAALDAVVELPGPTRAILAAAEEAGRLPEALFRRAARDERLARLIARIRFAAFFLCGYFVLGVLILAAPTGVRDGIGAYFSAVGPPLGLGVALPGALLWWWSRQAPTHPARLGLRSIFGRVPGLSRIATDLASSQVAEVLSECLAAGLSVRRSLPLALDAAGHPELSGAAALAVARLEQGSGLADALLGIRGLSRDLIQMIRQGETSGTLDQVLLRAAQHHADRAWRNAMAVLVALAAVFTALVLGMLVYGIIAGFVGYFDVLEKSL